MAVDGRESYFYGPFVVRRREQASIRIAFGAQHEARRINESGRRSTEEEKGAPHPVPLDSTQLRNGEKEGQPRHRVECNGGGRVGSVG